MSSPQAMHPYLFLASSGFSCVGKAAGALGVGILALASGLPFGFPGAAVGLILAARFLTAPFGTPVGPALASRVGTITAYRICQLALAMILLTAALAIGLGLPAFPILLIVSALSGLAQIPLSSLSQLVLFAFTREGSGWPGNVAALIAVRAGGLAVGSLFGGLLIASAGAAWCIALDALTFLPLIVITWILQPLRAPGRPKKSVSVSESVRDVAANHQLRRSCLAGAFGATLIAPIVMLVVPIARAAGFTRTGQAAALSAAIALGAILTPLLVRWLGKRRSALRAGVICYGIATFPLLAAIACGSPLPTATALAAFGVGLAAVAILNDSGRSFLTSIAALAGDKQTRAVNLSAYFLATSLGIAVGAIGWGVCLDLFGLLSTALGVAITAGCAALAQLSRQRSQ